MKPVANKDPNIIFFDLDHPERNFLYITRRRCEGQQDCLDDYGLRCKGRMFVREIVNGQPQGRVRDRCFGRAERWAASIDPDLPDERTEVPVVDWDDMNDD